MILHQTEVIKTDIRHHHLNQVERGLAIADDMPKLPAASDPNIVRKFRFMYGVTWRCVNLRYKISWSKRMSRLVVFWSCGIKARTLHELCFGPGKLHFLGFDQKPFWFNSSINENIGPAREKSNRSDGARSGLTPAVYDDEHMRLLPCI